MRDNPVENDDADADEAQNHSHVILVVGPHHDVVHVANEARHHDQRDVNHDKAKKLSMVRK